MKEKVYIAIDLKSFYASVECMYRSLDPLTTNLVVADTSRTEKTICLAVSPSLKSYGIPGRARLFEVIQKIKEINKERLNKAPFHRFTSKSFNNIELLNNPSLELDFIAATPQMALYIKYSTLIYETYLKYVSKDDIHVYSIDEVFIDVSDYLFGLKMNATELASLMVSEVYKKTGITATAGVGSNLYLAKIAMDILAKHEKPNKDGVRIASLNEESYRRLLWNHEPITDFWRVGKGYAKKLNDLGLFTMGDVARCSIGKANEYYNEELLYKTFGINAELLIDHAWGYEPTTIKDIKEYKPSSNCISTGQVLHCAYLYPDALLIVKEMADTLALDLVEKGKVSSQFVLTLGYDMEAKDYHGEMMNDRYGRLIPKHAHGTINIIKPTSSSIIIKDALTELFFKIINKDLKVKRINITANNIMPDGIKAKEGFKQLDLFKDNETIIKEEKKKEKQVEKEKKAQEAILEIKKKYGKNAVIKGMDLEDKATTIDRNKQIGGHKA